MKSADEKFRDEARRLGLRPDAMKPREGSDVQSRIPTTPDRIATVLPKSDPNRQVKTRRMV